MPTTPQTAIAPCPFCNSINIVHVGHQMACWACGCEGPDADDAAEASAIAEWNRRASQQAPADVPQALGDGFDGSRVRPGPNHSTIEIWYDTEAQARAAHKLIVDLIDAALAASPLPPQKQLESVHLGAASSCGCEACDPIRVEIVDGNLHSPNMRMIVCPICGNKRCPHATNHRNACAGSNAVGQKGSSWEHVKPPAP